MVEADLIVVGGGLAGVAAALEADSAGASVLLVAIGGGSSALAQGGLAAAVGPDDSPALHAEDTIAAGAGVTDPVAARLLTEAAPQAVRWLARQGIQFDCGREGRLALALEAAHSRPRVVHAGGDATGEIVMTSLWRRLAERQGVRCRLERGRLQSLLTIGSRVGGARFLTSAGIVEAKAGAVLLATGGFAGLFAATSTTADCDGSAQAIALEAGAELADLEFVQFHPTALAGPGRNHLITEAIRGAGGYILDLNGRRFLFDADPRGELAPRSTVTRAIVEKQAGRAGGVFLDVRHLPGAVLTARFPGFMRRCRERGIDPGREAVPIAPAAHYTMGGIVTDLDGRTSVAGLFAAGECARVGVHGANRLASNSLLEAAVYGPRAARAALAELRPIRGAALALSARSQPSAPIPAWISRVLSLSAGPVRSSVEIERGLGQLREGRTVGWQADAARTIGSLVLEAALLRQESRGAHYRADCPKPAQGWNELEVVSAAGATGVPDVSFRRRRGAGTTLELGPQSLAPVATECLPGVETPGSLH